MLQNRRKLSSLCWLVAGLPILATFIQASVALLGTSADGVPILGGLKKLLQLVAVFDAAGTVFRASSTIVLALFVLVTIAWLAQGAGLFALNHRVFALGATGSMTLFLVLFELVYLPLLSADVPTTQAAAFLLFPVATAAVGWAATLVFDWDVTLDEETSEQLSDARKRAREALQMFDERVDSVANDSIRSSLRRLAPDAVDSFESDAAAFREECQSVIDRTEEMRGNSQTSRERNEAATQVLADAEGLNPEEHADRLQRDLEQAVADRVRDEFSDIHYVSRYDEAYEVRNLRSYNEISLPALGGPPIQIGGDQHELADKLVDAIDTQGLAPVANSVKQIERHFSNLEAMLNDHEEQVTSALDAADEALRLAEDHLENLDGQARERLWEYLMEGRMPDDSYSVPNRPSISKTMADAKAALHETRFDAAERNAQAAREEAEAIQAIAEFFGESVIATVEYGSGSIPIPDTVGTEVAAQLRVPFEQSYDAEYVVEGTTLNIASSGDVSSDDHATKTHRVQTTASGANSDDVMYVLRELQSTATAASTDGTIELQTEQLPAKFVTDEILQEIQSCAERQGDVIRVTVPDDPPPGFLSIEVDESVSPQRVMDTLQNQYASSR